VETTKPLLSQDGRGIYRMLSNRIELYVQLRIPGRLWNDLIRMLPLGRTEEADGLVHRFDISQSAYNLSCQGIV